MISKKGFSSVLTILLLLSVNISSAQDNHFLYFQSASGEPFYIRLDGKLYSSTASGYIILAKLKSADYQMRIGFPRDAFPEEEFMVSVNGENEGYLLKYLGKSWVLMNMNTMKLTAGVSSQKQNQNVPSGEDSVQGNAFARMLADVVKDSSILKPKQNQQAPQETAIVINRPTDTAGFSAAIDSTKKIDTVFIAIDNNIAKDENKSSILKGEKEYQNELVRGKTSIGENQQQIRSDSVLVPDKQRGEKIGTVDSTKMIRPENPFVRIMVMNETGGQEMVFFNKETNDTVRVFMPVNNRLPDTKPQAKIIYKPQDQTDSNLLVTSSQPTTPTNTSVLDKTIRSTDTSDGNAVIIYQDKPAIQQEKESAKPDSPIDVGNNSEYTGCSVLASEKDFLKLRKRMAGENDNQKMLDIARKSFNTRCYTVDQIKKLSFLFLDDEGKYQFFDAAFGHVSDADLFYTLESLLKDSNNINRFKALLRN